MGIAEIRKRATVKLVIGILILCPVLGIVLGLTRADDNLIEIFVGVVWTGSCVVWYAMDCNEREIQHGKWFGLGVFLFTLLFIPVHLLLTRGLRGLAGIGIMVGIILVGSVLMGAGYGLGMALAGGETDFYKETASNEYARKILVARINQGGDINNPDTPRPLVSLEEFFEGNEDYGSIGYNFYPDQPSPAEFYEIFKTIRRKPEVYDVRVEIMDLEDPQGWPSTDTVWIITSVKPDTLSMWLGSRFQADEILKGFQSEYAIEPYDIPKDNQALGVWWD